MIDNTAVLSINRSLTGTDGEGYESAEDAAEATTFPGQLASRLFAADDALIRVYVDQNTLVMSRNGGWDEATMSATSTVVEDFFLFYPED